MSQNFLSGTRVDKLVDHSTANTTDVASGILDMSGFEWVAFLTSFGTAAADNLVKVQQDDVNATGGMADLLGSGLLSGASDEDVKVEVYRPTKRYVRLVALRGTSTTLESVWAIRGGARVVPVTNTTSGTDISEITYSPAEGTA